MASIALITGASGLIGRHVLAQWDVDGLEAETVDHERDDLLVPGVPTAIVQRVRPAVVVHLAWAASGRPGYRHVSDNERWVHSSLELARACTEMGAALIATGTSLDDTEPADAYSASKVRLRGELEPGIATGDLTWLRPYYVIDPEHRRPALIEQALSARDAGVPVALRTPDSEHDFIHAADVGSAIVSSVRHHLRGELPIGSGRLRRVSELVEALGIPWVSGGASAAHGAGHLNDVADNRRLRALGWAPAHTVELFERR
jgi:nucleoside-diphosphate-sugar epimerase